MFKFLKELDMFGAPVPGVNMQGKTEQKTVLGSMISIIIIGLTLFFALFKLQHMLIRKSPQVTTLVEEEGVPPDERFDLTDPANFMMAFTTEHW